VQFDITVSNTGLAPANNVGFTDVLPSFGGTWSITSDPSSKCSINSGTLTCSNITLAASTGSYTVTIQSTTDGSVCTKVENTANLTSPYSGSSKDAVTVNCPNVGIAKSAKSGTVNAGDNVQFDITVSNTGLAPANNVGFTDVLPSFGGTWSVVADPATKCGIAGNPLKLTCSGITLAASTGSYTVTIQSTTDGSVCTKVENTANLTSPYSGSSKDAVTVNCPNVGISKSPVSGTVNAGDDVGFTITVTNSGLAPANNVGFTDVLPNAGGTWTETSDPDNKCSISGSTLTCSGITLAANGGSYSVGVKSNTVKTTAAVCGTIKNTANLSSPYSGLSEASVTINCPKASLTVTKTIVGGGTQLFDFTQDTPTNTAYQLTDGQSKLTSNLSAGKYRVCEKNLAVSWKATAKVDGVTVSPLINPDDPDGTLNIDLGNRCVDVTLNWGDSRTVAWTNTPPPGGDARTIGYWKNWSSCTGGGQYTKAMSRNLYNKTLDGNLPQTVGILLLRGSTPPGGISPDCQKAVYILDKSDLSGKKQASDPAYNLAAQLLAAMLNKQAGAALCQVAANNITTAQTLLFNIGFNGTGSYLKKLNATVAAQANLLATKLEAYNSNKPSACV
jgi:uncharacterized repeat protein (TIGR01451 family)